MTREDLLPQNRGRQLDSGDGTVRLRIQAQWRIQTLGDQTSSSFVQNLFGGEDHLLAMQIIVKFFVGSFETSTSRKRRLPSPQRGRRGAGGEGDPLC